MAKYLKPQTPLQHQSGDYIYPITSVDQIITGNGERLNANLISINLNELVESDKTVLKSQNPMTKGSDYFYPLTTADQVIMDGGYRLNDIVGKVKKSTITLYANGWSAEAPYCYSVTVDGLSDKVNMKMLPHYPDDFEGKQAMKEETAKISFASRNGNILTFECWEEVPTIDIPVDIEIDITYPSKGLEVELNYSIVGGASEPEEPTENMIWVNTDNVEITNHIISKNEPSNPVEGMVWISDGDNSSIAFHSMKIANTYADEVYPISAKQYVSGAWVDKTAKSYQNGEWVDWWNGELFDNGNQFEWVTGGWEHCYPYQGTVEIGEELIVNAPTGKSAGLTTKNKIKLTNYKKLCFNITYISSGKISLHVSVNKENLINDTVITQDASVTGVAQIDLTGVPDEAYIAFHAGNGRDAKVSKIWLE